MLLIGRPPTGEELHSAELLFGDLGFPDQALSRIAELTRCPEEIFATERGWAAMLELDGSTVLASSDGATWSFFCPANQDEADAMHMARTLHGSIARQAEDWDLDR